jgi:hypothetical protein
MINDLKWLLIGLVYIGICVWSLGTIIKGLILIFG